MLNYSQTKLSDFETTKTITETEGVIVWPNPNKGEFTIYFGDILDLSGTIYLFDYSGQKLIESSFDDKHPTYYSMYTSGLPEGIYTIVIEVQNGQRFIDSIIIN